jgi:HEAT repeat protein
VLRQGPPELAVVIAEGFGLSANPQARVLLRSLANDPDEAIARGGARGWAVVGTDEAAQVLNGLLQGDTRPASVRAEAASALGEMAEAPAAYAALTNAAWQLKSPELVTSVLEGLGHRSIAESQAFFAEYLSNPAIPTDLRVAAVEALGNAAGDPSALLLRYAADADPEVRAGAAAALGSTEQKGSVGPDLLGLLQTETEPDVRMRLYQALGNQQQTDLGAVLESVQRESQTDVRIAGLDLLAQSLQDRPNAQLQAYFEQTGVPSLKETAMNAETSFERVSSVLALQRLTSAQSVAALEEVLQRSTDPKVMDAAKRALKQPR